MKEEKKYARIRSSTNNCRRCNVGEPVCGYNIPDGITRYTPCSSAAVQDSTGALKNGTDPQTNYTFRVNAVDLATSVNLPIMTDGTAIASQNGAFQLNAFTTINNTNRPFLTFTNASASDRIVTYFVNIQTQQASIGGT